MSMMWIGRGVALLSDGKVMSASFGCMEAKVPLAMERSRSCKKRVVLPASQGPTMRMVAPRCPDDIKRKIAAQCNGEKSKRADDLIFDSINKTYFAHLVQISQLRGKI